MNIEHLSIILTFSAPSLPKHLRNLLRFEPQILSTRCDILNFTTWAYNSQTMRFRELCNYLKFSTMSFRFGCDLFASLLWIAPQAASFRSNLIRTISFTLREVKLQTHQESDMALPSCFFVISLPHTCFTLITVIILLRTRENTKRRFEG